MILSLIVLIYKMNINNIDKIEWEFLGKFERIKNVWGKIKSVRACPVCNYKEMDLYRNKGRFKAVCKKCNYEIITKKVLND